METWNPISKSAVTFDASPGTGREGSPRKYQIPTPCTLVAFRPHPPQTGPPTGDAASSSVRKQALHSTPGQWRL